MQLEYERELHKREMEASAARHEADQQRIARLRLIADRHKRHAMQWETQFLGQAYHERQQPIFAPSTQSSVSTSTLSNFDVTASTSAVFQSTTSKATLNLLAEDLLMSSDEESAAQISTSSLQQSQSDFEAAVLNSPLPASILGRDAIRSKLAITTTATTSVPSSSSSIATKSSL